MSAPAVVVDAERADEALAALEAEGVYDDGRRLRGRDGRVEIPVTRPPAAGIGTVVEQTDPEPRVTGLEDRLRRRGFTEAEIEAAPGSWAVVGDVVLVRFGDCRRREAVAAELLDLQGAATVLAREGIEGPHREPRVEVVAGSPDTETVHVEHGTEYALDPAEVMFSPGNEAERVRTGEAVAEGERVLDPFAGVGYFTLPMARAGARVTAIERNPAAFDYLLENRRRNGVADRIRAVRGDCRDALASLAGHLRVERAVLGHYDAADYLGAVLPAVEPGGVVHLHAVAPEPRRYAEPVARLRAAAADLGRDVGIEARRTVKSHSEGVVHVVVDGRIR